MKHRRVGDVGIATEHLAGSYHADGGLAVLHEMYLHRRGVGPQQPDAAVVGRGQIESVVHLPRRMVGGNVEGAEVVPVVLHLRAGGRGKAHVGEDDRYLLQGAGYGMDGAGGPLPTRQSDVEAFGHQPGIHGLALQNRAPRLQSRIEGGFYLVGQHSELGALLWGYLAQTPENLGQCPLLAQGADPDLFEAGRGVGGRKFCKGFCFQCFQLFAHGWST